MPNLNVSLDPEDIEAFNNEIDDVNELATRGDLTAPEAQRWAEEAAGDMAERLEIRVSGPE